MITALIITAMIVALDIILVKFFAVVSDADDISREIKGEEDEH